MNLTKRQKTILRYFAGLVVLGSFAAAIAFNFLSKGGESDSQESSFTTVSDVQTLPVIKLAEVDSYQRTVVHTGTVQTKSHTMVAFQRGGMVTDLMVEEGQHVEALQDVATLDSRHLHAQKDSLTAKLAQANSVLAELEKGPRQQSISAARDIVTDLEQQLKAQELRSRRSASLLRSNSIAKQDYERELYATRGLEARLSAAQNQLDELRAGTRTEQIDAQESSIKSIQAELQAIQYNIDDCQLQAPFNGMIVTRYIDSGTVVTAGTPVYELIDDKNLEVHVGVPQSFLGQLQPGAIYNVIAGETTLQGTLRVILPRVDAATRTCKAILDVSLPVDTHANLLTGQLAKVQLSQEIKESGFWIPRLALTADHAGLWSCLVVEPVQADSESAESDLAGLVARKHTVEILHHRDEWVFVRGTLRDGQILIRDGMHRVVPGQRVQIHGDESSSDSTTLTAIPSSVAPE